MSGFGESRPNARGQFLIDAVERAIGQDGDYVACFELWCDGVDDRVSVGVQFSLYAFLTQSFDHVFGV